MLDTVSLILTIFSICFLAYHINPLFCILLLFCYLLVDQLFNKKDIKRKRFSIHAKINPADITDDDFEDLNYEPFPSFNNKENNKKTKKIITEEEKN
uniref:Uncharacterized protein n=1 Tax=Faxonius propinquus nudivirus TaxID=3139431 RepID=A0AAU8GBL0_9VIRU